MTTLHYEDSQAEIHKVVVGPMDNNVYVLRCKQTGDAVLRLAGSGRRLTWLRRTEDRHGVLAPSRAGSRPDIGWPLPKNFVPASTVTIGGELEGNIESASRVELLATGVLTGDLKAGSLTVAGGSRMECESWFIVLEPLEKTSH